MIKKLKSFFILILLVLFGVFSIANSLFQTEFLKLEDAEKKWGSVTLQPKEFKAGDLTKRGPMAVDIVKRSLYVGQNRKNVRNELGDPDSYFFSDTIFAYKIMPFPGENKEIWHLVFIPDKNLKKIKEVKIHKKCCYN